MKVFRFVSLFSLLLLWCCTTPTTAQQRKTREQLEREKERNLQKIKELNQALDQTNSKKEAGLQKVKILKRRIETQNKQIDLLADNIDVIEGELSELNQTTTNLSFDLQKLRFEYSRMIFQAAKKSNSFNRLSFLFSARDFNDFTMRYQYLKQYSEARRKQVKQLEQVRNLLFAKQAGISTKKKEQEQVLQSKVSETHNLETLKKKQNTTLEALSKQEQNLKQELNERKRAVALLESRISNMIEREIAASRKRAERRRQARIEKSTRERAERDLAESTKKETKKKDKEPEPLPPPPPEEPKKEEANTRNEVMMDEAETSLASSFSRNKNRLPWPVKGFISERFGIHEYKKGVQIRNDGVDIQTQSGESARSIFDGIVLHTDIIQGMGRIVIIQHGNYFTVYSRLSNVFVGTGQRVRTKEAIGTVATGRDGIAEINFQIWHNATKLNPESWLIDK
jgi:murein hydrolase activator